MKNLKNAVGDDDDDEVMDESEIDEVEGWDFEFKLQDYTQVKHLS